MVENISKEKTDTKIKYGEKDLKKLLSELIKEEYILLIKSK